MAILQSLTLNSTSITNEGSSKFGDTPDDLHQFTGSLQISGSLGLPGISDVSASIAELQSSGTSGGATNIIVDNFTGNDSTTTFGISNTIVNENNLIVVIDGVYQSKLNFSTSGANVVFSSPPHSGADIEITHFVSVDGGTPNIGVNTYSGDDSTTDFTLSTEVSTKNNLFVFINGVKQSTSNYSISGTNLSFTSAPPLGSDNIEVVLVSNIIVDGPVTSVDGKTGVVSTNYGAQVISTNTNAVKNTVYVLTADLTLTLPSPPSTGDTIKISNQSDVATCVIARNGSNIMGLAEDLTLDNSTLNFELIYTNAAKGWVII